MVSTQASNRLLLRHAFLGLVFGCTDRAHLVQEAFGGTLARDRAVVIHGLQVGRLFVLVDVVDT